VIDEEVCYVSDEAIDLGVMRREGLYPVNYN
jgi:3-deoxy-D-manno-octulosonate 8-phosphate phosphatase KdsC-like HAD superfamily phosphatase